mgnify:CR=1 FL=1
MGFECSNFFDIARAKPTKIAKKAKTTKTARKTKTIKKGKKVAKRASKKCCPKPSAVACNVVAVSGSKTASPTKAASKKASTKKRSVKKAKKTGGKRRAHAKK